MNLHIARWGNSLALRLPAEVVRSIGLKEGDNVEAYLTTDGALTIRAVRWDRKAFADQVGASRDKQPMGSPVMDELRRETRY